MKSIETLLFIVFVLCHGVVSMGKWNSMFEEEKHANYFGKGREEMIGEELFLLKDMMHVVRTDAGEVKVTKSPRRAVDRPLHIGFITMEPNSLFIPQYADSNLVLFINEGEAKVGSIYKDGMVHEELREGDLYGIPAGSTFYLVNTNQRHKLHVICSIDPIEDMGIGTFQSFFVGGGTYPMSILDGFDHETLATAFNVSESTIKKILTGQQKGPIVHIHESDSSVTLIESLRNEHKRSKQWKKTTGFVENAGKEENQVAISWRKLLKTFLGDESNMDNKENVKSKDSYNIFDRCPSFINDYGWSFALDKTNYSPLKHSGLGIYLFNLSAGSMMAPHVNPQASEYGVVLKGSGRIQIVFPNGSPAMNVLVKEGDVFWVPRYFPFCQIASEDSPLEIFGFTTSSHKEQPQFLAGQTSILGILEGPELAAAFGMDEKMIKHILQAQTQSVILPPKPASSSRKGMHGHKFFPLAISSFSFN